MCKCLDNVLKEDVKNKVPLAIPGPCIFRCHSLDGGQKNSKLNYVSVIKK